MNSIESKAFHELTAVIEGLCASLSARDDEILRLRDIANVNGNWTLKYSQMKDRAESAEADNAALREAVDIKNEQLDRMEEAIEVARSLLIKIESGRSCSAAVGQYAYELGEVLDSLPKI